MNIAITAWGNRISPVFDSSQMLLIVEIDGNDIIDQKIVKIEVPRFVWFQKIFEEMNIQLLICGAICKAGISRFESVGVEVAPFITGEVERILEQFINNKEIADFAMPGCMAGRCCRRPDSTKSVPRQVLKAGCEQ